MRETPLVHRYLPVFSRLTGERLGFLEPAFRILDFCFRAAGRFPWRRWAIRFAWVLLALLAALPLAAYALLAYLPLRASFVREAEEWGEAPPRGEFDPSFDEKRTSPGGRTYTLNLSPATFELDLSDPDPACRRIFQDYRSALRFARENGLPLLPSVFLVRAKAKAFDDRAVAAMELALQDGIPDRLLGKQVLLERLYEDLLDLRARRPNARDLIDSALVHIASARRLGGETLRGCPDPVADLVRVSVEEFLGCTIEAKPIGFYTRSETLEQIFRQDRYLFRGPGPDSRRIEHGLLFAWLLGQNAEMDEAYKRLVAANQALAGRPLVSTAGAYAPFVSGLEVDRLLPGATIEGWILARARDQGGVESFALFGPCTGPEDSIFERFLQLADDRRMDFMDAVISGIRRGEIDLAPRDGEGWYQHQVYALETLAAFNRSVEATKLGLTRAYRLRLEEAFRVALAKERETFAKFMLPMVLMRGETEEPEEILLSPSFSVEPMATVYLRTARAYRVTRAALIAAIGEEAADGVEVGRGPVGEPAGLLAALAAQARLHYGLFGIACREMGLSPAQFPGEIPDTGLGAAIEAARDWLAHIEDDPDLGEDTRVCVPITAFGTTRYWGTLGVRLERLSAKFGHQPSVSGHVKPRFVPADWWSPSEVFCEFLRPGGEVLDREEYRRLCDGAGGDLDRLREALGAVGSAGQSGLRVPGSWPLWLAAAALVAGWGITQYRRRRWRFPLAMAKQGVVALLALEALCGGLYFASQRARAEMLLRFVAPLNWLGLMRTTEILEEIDPDVRSAALARMIRSRDTDQLYAGFCILAFNAEDVARDGEAADALRAALFASLEDEDPSWVAEAISRLGWTKDPDVLPRLEEAARRFPGDEGICQGLSYACYILESEASLLRLFDFVALRSSKIAGRAVRYLVYVLSAYGSDSERRGNPHDAMPRLMERVRRERPQELDAFLQRVCDDLLRLEEGGWTYDREMFDAIRAVGGASATGALERVLRTSSVAEIRREAAGVLFDITGERYPYRDEEGVEVRYQPPEPH